MSQYVYIKIVFKYFKMHQLTKLHVARVHVMYMYNDFARNSMYQYVQSMNFL